MRGCRGGHRRRDRGAAGPRGGGRADRRRDRRPARRVRRLSPDRRHRRRGRGPSPSAWRSPRSPAAPSWSPSTTRRGRWSPPSSSTPWSSASRRARARAGVIAAAPVTDTLKRVGDAGAITAHRAARRALWAAQTPQVFRAATLRARARRRPGRGRCRDRRRACWSRRLGGDGAGRAGRRPTNLKVTTAADLRLRSGSPRAEPAASARGSTRIELPTGAAAPRAASRRSASSPKVSARAEVRCAERGGDRPSRRRRPRQRAQVGERAGSLGRRGCS